ncbi:MAG: hypothetical protein J6S63_01910 [Atopobiaceae bacterium]|nr:hypothetical protein [Atopobiaceae bacterium]
MTSVVPVKFAYAVRDLWFDQARSEAQEGDHVICSTERGTEIGLVTAPARQVGDEELGHKIGNATLKPVLRIATDADLAHADMLARKGDEAFPVFRELVGASELDMKPVGVEYLFGGEKVVCYFAAEERVDFRQLVRDLSKELHQRIDMRQIGVREEAAVVGGFGHCGQELCCARFGLAFEPVSIRMAKEQDLPLTSNKISGACGRLMCCLRYEFEAYRDFKGRAPKRNAVIDTPLGKAKVVEYDTPKEQLALRLENGKVIRIPLAEMVASEAAVKKSEDLHCPCRPDTVVRASLDRLNSPDVQMALAELDRKNGVVPEEAFEEADIFVESKPRKRRNRRRGSTQAAAPEASQRQAAADAPAEPAEKRTRRRRRKRAGSGSADAAASQGNDATQAPRTSSAAPSPADKQSAEGKPKETTRRRRRHRTAAGDASAQQPTAQGKQQAAQGKQAAKPRRRPGDRGGQKPPQHMRTEPQQDKPDDTANAPKRRRRRRRGGNGGGSNKPTASE